MVVHYLVLKYRLLKSIESDHPGQVEVVRYVTRKGSTFPEHYWVDPNNLKFFDTKEELEHYCQEEHPQRKIVWG